MGAGWSLHLYEKHVTFDLSPTQNAHTCKIAKLAIGGGNSNISQFDGAIFSNGLVQPPTSYIFFFRALSRVTHNREVFYYPKNLKLIDLPPRAMNKPKPGAVLQMMLRKGLQNWWWQRYPLR